MKPYYEDSGTTIYHGDCREVMRSLEANSVDAIICDPPYGLEFMGKEWDKLNAPSDGNGFRRTENEADVGRDSVFGRVSRTSPEYKTGGAGVERDAKSAGGFGKDSPTNENAYAAARIRYGKSVANMQEWHRSWAVEALRVLKPGAHLLAFGGTRTHHRLMCGLEDAGFEIRDCVMWVYGSGFPKSLDVGRAIDKELGAEATDMGMSPNWRESKRGREKNNQMEVRGKNAGRVTAPASDEAKQWEGWGTALKPAWEPIIIARKPLEGTVAENVLKWGTGALNIDACRVEGPKGNGVWGSSNKTCQEGRTFNGSPEGKEYRSELILARPLREARRNQESDENRNAYAKGLAGSKAAGTTDVGRFPANLIHDGSDEVLELFPTTTSGTGAIKRVTGNGYTPNAFGKESRGIGTPNLEYGDTGSTARFFYTAKASNSDRGNRIEPAAPLFGVTEPEEFRNTHPTVKPIALMEYLIKLVMRPDGLLLDCFLGSGSTLVAAKRLGIRAVGIESDEASCQIAVRRIERC